MVRSNANTLGCIDKPASNRLCATVSDVPLNRALSHRIDLPEERMNTKYADIEVAAARLRADMANRDGAAERLRADMERFRPDMVRRDAVNTRWMIGTIAAATVIILTGVRLIVGG